MEDPEPQASARERVRALDGLRALAVVAVVCFHAQIPGAGGGFLGVSAFFTLSGFLITTLLLDEHARHGRISLRAFWGRRARRLLPAAYVALAAVVMFGATVATADQLRSLRGDVVSALAYVANWHFLFAGRSYEQIFSAPSPVLHFWSLAIEEQFYLLFPLLVLVALRIFRGRRVAVGALFAVGIVASVIAGRILLTASGPTRVYYGTDTRAAELLVGALLAVVLARARIPRFTARGQVAVSVAGGAALATMVFWWVTVDQQTRWLYEGGFAAHALLTAVVIVAALVEGPFARALAWRPLAALGLISYGVYLFHWPIFLWLSPERTGLTTAPLFAVRITLTLLVAIVSYVVVEHPVRVRPAGWLKVVAPAAAALLVAGLLAVTVSPPKPEIVLSALGDTPSPLPALPPELPKAKVVTKKLTRVTPIAHTVSMYRRPATTRPLRILVVGDSVGITLGRGIELWAREHGGAEVRNVAKLYCPLGRGLPARQGMTENDAMYRCDWSRTWPNQVRGFDPDVVVVMFSIWEGSPRNLPGLGWQAPGNPVYDGWQLSEYQAAADTLAAGGAHIVWMNVPCTRDGAATPDSWTYKVDRHTIPRLAATRPNVHAIDLEKRICPADRYDNQLDGVPDARPDGTHFSDAGALTVARWAMPIVLGHAAVPRYARS